MSLTRLPLYLSIAILTACGGGGGGGGSTTPTPPPVTTNDAPSLGAIGDQSVAEGDTSVVTASATDNDGDALTFSLSGDDATRFSITSSGALSFVDAPDFESPTDANQDNRYDVTVSVRDPSNESDSESFTVVVTDVLDGRVVDGPISGAQVELLSGTANPNPTVTTDVEGYFRFADVPAADGQRLVVRGGKDEFTDNELPDLVLVTEVSAGATSLAQINALTTVLAEAGSAQAQTQFLQRFGITLTADELARTDVWLLAQNDDAAGAQAQRVNFQLAALFAAVTKLVDESAGAQAPDTVDITLAIAAELVTLATESSVPVSLAKEATLETLVTRVLNALGVNAPPQPVLRAFLAALADLNTVLAEELAPTSDIARDVASAVQTGFQSSVAALATAGDVPAFDNAASASALFNGISVGPGASDADEDGLPDALDPDDDGDEVRDGDDAFPNDPNESADSDGDGVGDNGDAFPADPNETLDSDDDGVGDNTDAFPNDATETQDSDGDGIGDNADAFPNDAGETTDTDGDGVGDNTDAFPNDASETQDSDGDGVGDNDDAFPNDSSEQLDTDNDGTGNNADPDDDGDGVIDEEDIDPLDPNVSGFFVSGRLTVTPEVIIDSDTNDPDNAFARNNLPGIYTPDDASVQAITAPFIVHGYVNEPGAGAAGPLKTSGAEDDFFLVDALAGQRFLLHIHDDAQDLDFYLYDQSKNIVAGSENPPEFRDPEGFQEVLTVPSDGTYYLNVYAYPVPSSSTAANYTVTTDFEGAVQAQPAMRAGEVIVGLKTNRQVSRDVISQRFSSLASRHNLEPAAQSLGKFRLMRSKGKSLTAKATPSHPKHAHYASQRLRNEAEVAEMVKSLSRDPEVEYAEPNYVYQRHATTDDPLLPDMWHLEQVNASTAWDKQTGDPSVIVAVIDNGVLAQHPDFLGQTPEPGYDFISTSNNYDGDGIDPDPEDATPLEDSCAPDGQAFYHGAHVGGTVGATGNNAEGIVGVSYTVTLMHLRALDGDCGGSSYDIAQSILYAIGEPNDSGTVPANTASVVNMSLGGGGQSLAVQNATNTAAAKGVIVVSSSGNDGGSAVGYPAANDNTFAVGATGLDGKLASYSTRGPKLDLVAPGGGNGGGVLSLNKEADANGDPSFTYTSTQGTSMASPHAAGIFALMKSEYPGLTTARLETLLEAGVLTDDLGDSGFDNATGWGLIKADKAVDVARADAAGTFVLPARLVLSSNRLYFDGATTTVMVTGTNPGEAGLQVTSFANDSNWLVVTERNDAAQDEVGRWDISVDRSGLAPGFYTDVVTYTAIEDSENQTLVSRISVSLRVGKQTGGDVGTLDVFLTDSQTGAVVTSATTSAEDGYAYELAVEAPGDYRITASTDTDGDGDSARAACRADEACGRLGGVSTPETVTLSGARSDLDITVLTPPER